MGDEIVALMRDWSTYAAKHANATQVQRAVTVVQRWLRDARTMKHPGILSAETTPPVLVPTNEQTASMEKAGRAILKEFKLSLAWSAPLTYGRRYFLKEVGSMLANPLKAPAVVRQSVTMIYSLVWKVAKAPFQYVLVPTGKVTAGVVADVGRGFAKGGERLIGTLDFFTKNLTPIAIAAVALYFAPQILGQVGRAKRAYRGG